MIMESNLDQHLKRAYIARLYSARTTPGHPVAAATRVSF
jgi:hypothetical protein